jgi:N-acetylglucosaminyl-diphospho-decaprenol L-rhamnosyltransferase
MSSDSQLAAESADSTPWCSLITVTYNSREALERFWGSRTALPAGVEWIVVDNASTDDSAQLAENLGASRVIRNTRNLGFSAANNLGLAASAGEFIGFVNPDVRVNGDDLQALHRLAQTQNALVSPQLMNADGSLQPNGRGFPFLIDKVRNRLSGAARLANRYLLFSETGQPRAVCWLMGASVFGCRDTITRLGGWDSHFFVYYEDKDLSLRAWQAGVRVLLEPAAQWTHGWARETLTANVTPWKNELTSMAKFSRRYPEFLLGASVAARIHTRIQREMAEDTARR